MSFSEVEKVGELVELLNYDDRTPPNWHGLVGRCALFGDVLIADSSWADPRRGTNEERLRVAPNKKGLLVLTGYDELGKDFKVTCPAWMTRDEAVKRMLKSVESGGKYPLSLVRAIRGERRVNDECTESDF